MGHAAVIFVRNPGGRLSIKMSSYPYRDPYVKDKKWKKVNKPFVNQFW